MTHARTLATLAGALLALALPAAHAQVPTPQDMEKVAPKKDEPKKDAAKKDAAKKDAAKKPAPKKAPTQQAKKAEPAAAPKAEAPKQVPKTYSTGPTVLRDKDGNVIPTSPDAYPVDSAQGKARR